MQASDSVVGAPMAAAGTQSRSEDEESLGVKDVKRTAVQAFGSGVPKRRSSSRFDLSLALLQRANLNTETKCVLLSGFSPNIANIISNCILCKIINRSIKRRKFDDELVESSLVKSSSRVKGPPVIEPVRCPGSEPSSSEKKKVCTGLLQFFFMFGKDAKL